MSLTIDRGDIVFECDGCHAMLETGTSNFEAARNLLRRQRWKPRRKSAKDDWLHCCPDCKPEDLLDRLKNN